MNKGAELDKQIFKEGDSTWGCKEGWLPVMDVKRCFRDIETKILKKFGMNAGMVVINIIGNETGKRLWK